jgi:hypothetical protein
MPLVDVYCFRALPWHVDCSPLPMHVSLRRPGLVEHILMFTIYSRRAEATTRCVQ